MAQVSKCDQLPAHRRNELIGRIGQGASWRELEAEFSIPMSSIRSWAERNSFGRSPVDAKRKAVDDILAKTASFDGEDKSAQETAQRADSGNPDIDAAAKRDADVVRLSSFVCISIIRRCAERAKVVSEPKDLVSLATANEKAMGTYARINKLDDAPAEIKRVVWEGHE